MLAALTILLLFQLLGEILVQWLGLPVPGPVLGMIFLFLALAWRGGPSEELRQTSNTLLQHLSLLFVPAGAGITVHFARLGDEWLPILLSVLVSTVLTIAVTSLVLRFLLRHRKTEEA
ncbi:MAG: CidA/LrgA family protein [Rhodocyclaceae bacterium]|nr:CidA/LrgA family protein [Rhodocyclaceae bacterium]